MLQPRALRCAEETVTSRIRRQHRRHALPAEAVVEAETAETLCTPPASRVTRARRGSTPRAHPAASCRRTAAPSCRPAERTVHRDRIARDQRQPERQMSLF